MDGYIVANAAETLFSALDEPAGDVLLASPYLTRDIARRIAGIASVSQFDWLLLTRLDAPAVANGYLSVEGLQALLDGGVRIVDCRHLHAKAYVVGDEFGLVGSANLTGAGLGTTFAKNRELSIRLDPAAVGRLRDQLRDWASDGNEVDAARVNTLAEDAANLPKAKPAPPSSTAPTLPSTYDIEQLLLDARDRRLWVKAQYGEPHLDHWRTRSWFSSPKKGKPGFEPSDLVLIYALKVPGVYVVVEIVDEALHDQAFVADQSDSHEAGERWPWVNRTIPRLVPESLTVVTPDQLGISGQGLQNGHKELTLSEFTAAVRALADGM